MHRMVTKNVGEISLALIFSGNAMNTLNYNLVNIAVMRVRGRVKDGYFYSLTAFICWSMFLSMGIQFTESC